jgi:hypothetical protein
MIEPIYNREFFSTRCDAVKNQHVKDITDLIEFFKTKFNLKLHIHYGTLLGTIRDHDFICHDKDIDLVYISEFSHKEVVKKELIDIAEILRSYGMLIKDFNNRGQMHVKVPNGSLVVDVFTSWISNEKYNLIPFGEICSEDIIYPFKSSMLRCVKFEIPNQSEKLMDILYRNWKNLIPKDENYLKLPKRSNLL